MLRHPMLADRAEKMQLLNMPYLTKQAWLDLAGLRFASVLPCCSVMARYGQYFFDRQMRLRDTGKSWNFGLEKARIGSDKV